MIGKRKIAVLTGTRADYGLLKHLIREIHHHAGLELCLIVTGSHLSEALGMTVREIEADGFPIAYRLSILGPNTSVTAATSLALGGVGEILQKERPHSLVVLGDRYESFSATAAATLLNVPVAHIHGGELTLGAVDDALRHSMTKMSWWHFTTAEVYRERVIRLGEDPKRVFNFGAMVMDALEDFRVSEEELQNAVGVPLKRPLVVATLHPETRSPGKVKTHLTALWQGLRMAGPGLVVFTKANADAEGTELNLELERLIATKEINAVLVSSLGHHRYLGMLKSADVAVGNSSSLVIEAPIIATPAVNIGQRQEGRVRSAAVHDVPFVAEEICRALQHCWQRETKEKLAKASHPFGKPGVAKKIVDVLANEDLPTSLAKGFYE